MTSQERLTIRLARPGDARAIADVHVRSWRATYAETLSPGALERLDAGHREALWAHRVTAPASGQIALVATTTAGLVGFLFLGPTPDADDDPEATGQVLSVHVDPDVTGRGVGTALLAHAVDELTGRGYADATLWVVSGNRRARRFYERAGWARDGVSRQEPLAVEGETGDEVTVVRYRLPLTRDRQPR